MLRQLIAVTVAVSGVASAQVAPSRGTIIRLADSLAADFVASNASPSVAVAVVRGRDTLLLKAYGRADVPQNLPATAATVYRIGSITKQFTAAVVMQLVEQGKVTLDDSIGAYVPSLPAAWRGVRIRQLLNHTSGIPSYTDAGSRWNTRWSEVMTPETIVAITANDTMWFAPGTKFRYDNTGYVVLGMLIERVTGRAWSTEVHERFAKPLSLGSTKTCAAKPTAAEQASGYMPAGPIWLPAPFIEISQPYAAGAMCSTVGDLARWNAALHSGKVVGAESYRMMTTPEGAAAVSRYGFGLSATSAVGHRVITHGGGIHGFVSANMWFPDDTLSVTVLANTGRASPDRLALDLARAVLGVAMLPPPTRVTLTATDLERYAGVYSLLLPTGARDFMFTVRGDTLYAQLEGQGANPLIAYVNHTFGAAFDPSLRIVFTLDGGRATKLTLLQGGERLEGMRKQR